MVARNGKLLIYTAFMRGVYKLLYDENKLVKVKWNNSNKIWYENKGYKYTKRYDEFYVKQSELPPKSKYLINVICDYCGDDYITTFGVVYNGRKNIKKDCCSKCTGLKTSEVSLYKRADKFIKLAESICEKYGYVLLTTINEYSGIKTNIKFICPKHGEQEMLFDNFIRGHKCIDCSYEERGMLLRHDINFIIKEVESVNNNILLNPSEYKDTFTRNLRIKCACGNIFITSFSNYTKHDVTQCYSYSQKESNSEKRIKEFLSSNNIIYEQEKRFEDCRDIKPLPFDFYLPERNIIIEYDGEHHYIDVFNNGHLQIVQNHDAIKNNYCKFKNIKLLRIPYWEKDNIEQILISQLNV